MDIEDLRKANQEQCESLETDIKRLYTFIERLDESLGEIDDLRKKEKEIAERFANLYEKLASKFRELTDIQRDFFRHWVKFLEKYYFWKKRSQIGIRMELSLYEHEKELLNSDI